MKDSRVSRRRFIKLGLAGAGIPLIAGTSHIAFGGELVELAEDDPTAKALAYHKDASAVNAAEYPNFKDGQICANCLHYKGDLKSADAACALFPGKSVAGKGWCKVWAAKPA